MRLALAILVAAAGVAPVALGAVSPALKIVQHSPLVVSGSHFRGNELVTVTARLSGPRVAHVVANASGSFRASFGPVKGGRCALLRVDAVGARGSRAILVFRRSACTTTVSPTA